MLKLIDLLSEAKKLKETFEEFANIRGKGAAKIADTAEKKGGLALLTWHHFKVKAPYYKKANEGKLDLKEAEKAFFGICDWSIISKSTDYSFNNFILFP
jgi:hypothetical protein